MSISKKNNEGYIDMTAYEALTAIAKAEKAAKTDYCQRDSRRPLVYIASPFAGDTESNVRHTQGYCRFAVGKGAVPLAPHLLYPQFMDDSVQEQRELGLRFALILLGKCDELWVFGSRISDGMSAEIAKAKKRGIRIKYWSENCEEVQHNAKT